MKGTAPASGRAVSFDDFRRAVEGYRVGVRRENMLPLGNAASAWAAYLAAFHRPLHVAFAHRFLPALPTLGELGDVSLKAKVEVVVRADGSVDRVGFVETSPNMSFD
jgi:hypothetical protein